MKFKGRNGGLAIEMRNHIIATRIWVISLLILSIPTIIFVCINNPYFYIFLIIPALNFILSFFVFALVKTDENVFLQGQKKDHIFEIKDGGIYKDKRLIKLYKCIKIYRYPRFLYMETTHSMFIIKDTDYTEGNRAELISWAKANGIKVLYGY